MPFPNEKANRLGHVPVVNNRAVQEAFSRWRVAQAAPENTSAIQDACVSLDELKQQSNSDDVTFAITVDGSDTEVEATREYPTIKVGYIRIAGSFLDIEKLHQANTKPFVDPKVIRQSHSEAAFDAALPGSGLISPGLSGVDTWRQELEHFLQTARIDDDSPMTLADALLVMHGAPGKPATHITLNTCPNCGESRFPSDNAAVVSKSGGRCPACRGELYLADVLRTHEEYSPEGSNVTPLTRVMVIAERLMTLSYMEHFFTAVERPEEVFRRTVFITDGPLALYGVVAPLKRRIYDYHQSLQQWCADRGLIAPLVVGVEKSGTFVEHADQIAEMIPKGHVMKLTRSYINRITGRPEHNIYGRDEFYGRRFIYRTTTGSALVITVPPAGGVRPYEGEEAEDFASYPTLHTVCEVLDSLQTRLYPNAVIPVALAHHAAALPLGVGQSVLRAMAQKGIGVPTNTQIRNRSPYQSTMWP